MSRGERHTHVVMGKHGPYPAAVLCAVWVPQQVQREAPFAQGAIGPPAWAQIVSGSSGQQRVVWLPLSSTPHYSAFLSSAL
jgi:hypothetical protein